MSDRFEGIVANVIAGKGDQGFVRPSSISPARENPRAVAPPIKRGDGPHVHINDFIDSTTVFCEESRISFEFAPDHARPGSVRASRIKLIRL
ncbi:hypothetical protein A3D71_02210 [Candidatus Kaiserbacteria bacterium RIFCSPHIGHO2_02_FULL_55_20]|uniref:CSD domain-containing protein n=1 Tax=Candidatus Kaiserbacteria bacterium RIFCSPHIGHO2_02_FULL_55_20 TaxID=1798497 RepID=A0A1F6DW14_9BACT|nr:MAG: hypothetical protein A2680_01220 [Candidatus Kaiserbacteria bacterium RIFCSPHIGHO2_01_FULL_55_37]OGG65566.1 MAG: hypothetical protein A3D71_02210 [Candidatus Kaiserbacteria bacterium RIFCSPHIGHO2_02_FULL_55_20]